MGVLTLFLEGQRLLHNLSVYWGFGIFNNSLQS